MFDHAKKVSQEYLDGCVTDNEYRSKLVNILCDDLSNDITIIAWALALHDRDNTKPNW